MSTDAISAMHFVATENEDFATSRLVTEEDNRPSKTWQMYSIPTPPGTLRTGVWYAEPGTYNHPGGGHETFVVLDGEADFDLPTGTVLLVPGSVAHIPAGTPTVMRVRKTLRKVTVIVYPEAAQN